jgi:hypothetical protein
MRLPVKFLKTYNYEALQPPNSPRVRKTPRFLQKRESGSAKLLKVDKNGLKLGELGIFLALLAPLNCAGCAVKTHRLSSY